MRSTRIVGGVAAVVAVALLIPTTGHATPILDQSFSSGPLDIFGQIESFHARFGLIGFPLPTAEFKVFQSFTAGLAGVLDSVDIYIQKNGVPDQNVIVDIVSTANPLGSALATGFVTPSSVSTGSDSFVSVDLRASNLLVSVGEALSIRLSSLNNFQNNVKEYIADGNFLGGYAGGEGSQWTTDSGGTFVDTGDFYFRTLVDVPQGVPEPSTLALFGFGLLSLIGFGLMRRRLVIH